MGAGECRRSCGAVVFIIVDVKMAHGHDTITEHPIHGESQSSVNTVLLLPLLQPRPQLLLLQYEVIKTKLLLTAVPAYPLAK